MCHSVMKHDYLAIMGKFTHERLSDKWQRSGPNTYNIIYNVAVDSVPSEEKHIHRCEINACKIVTVNSDDIEF